MIDLEAEEAADADADADDDDAMADSGKEGRMIVHAPDLSETQIIRNLKVCMPSQC